MTDTELFWTIVAAIGQVAGAFATAAAVAISLWVVLSERKPRLRINAGVRLVFGGGMPAEDVISISVANVGMRRFQCTSIGWRTGYFRRGPAWWRRQYAIQTPCYHLHSVQLPFDLEPGEEKSIILDPQPMIVAVNQAKRDALFCRKPPWSESYKPTRIHVVVSVAAHKSVHKRVEGGLALFLSSGKIEKGAAEINNRK